MILDYYQHELELLRQRSKYFARLHPALAHMLSEESDDPDVERILEGCASLTANIRQKLDDEFPELIHALVNVIAPHYLRPVPSATIMAFTPRRGLNECLTIPRRTLLNSKEIEGTACSFATCSDVEIAPLEITRVILAREMDNTGVLSIHFSTLNSLPLSQAAPKKLKLYCTGPYPEAARRIKLLCMHATKARIIPEKAKGAAPLVLRGESLFRLTGFEEKNAILPYPVQSFPAFRYLQEFFMMPERFCQVEMPGFEKWTSRGTAQKFSIEISLKNLPDDLPSFNSHHLHLFATPAVNIFPMDGKPINLNLRKDKYIIEPDAGKDSGHCTIYSVEKITGIRQGESTPREYSRFVNLNPGSRPQPVYHLSTSITAANELLVKLSVGQMLGDVPVPEIISVSLLCTNGKLPERLHAGDICRPTESSPLLADFTNLRPPTAAALPPLGDNTLWRLLSHLFLNYLSVATTDNIRSILKLYIFGRTGDNASQVSHIGRIDGIQHLEVHSMQKLLHGELLRGKKIDLILKSENFANDGDMFVFSAILNTFLSSYASVNTFTMMHMTDTNGHMDITWPARLGSRPQL